MRSFLGSLIIKRFLKLFVPFDVFFLKLRERSTMDGVKGTSIKPEQAMNTSRTIQAISILFSLLLATSAFALDTRVKTVNLCLGESETLRAPTGYGFSYTEPKYGAGFPSMEEEVARSQVFTSENSDQSGAPFWAALKPNDSLLAGQAGDLSHNPAEYMIAAFDNGRSRAVIQARSEGVSAMEIFAINATTGHTFRQVVKVRTTQCGASTEIGSPLGGNLCKGEAQFSTHKTQVIRGNDNVYSFRGQNTGDRFLAGVKNGRSVLRHMDDAHGVLVEKMAVLPEGKGTCGYADAARLDALDGENTYVLQLCEGETWVSPMARTISSVTYSGNTVFAESSERNDGFAVEGAMAGMGEIHVQFKSSDATDMRIFVEVTSCN